MSADGARKVGPPHLRAVPPREHRAERLHAIGELVRMHRDLERALERAPDSELARIAAAARTGEHVLEDWARRIELFRAFKRRFEAGLHPADLSASESRSHVAFPLVTPTRRLPLRWEIVVEMIVAFIVGFAISLLMT